VECYLPPQRSRGLGIEVLEIKNLCLLSKWLDKLINQEGVWQKLLHNKYLNNKTLSQVTVQPHDSPFWRGLMKVKDEFFKRGSFIVNNDMSTRFWEDTWLGNRPLADQYPSLYSIIRNKNVTVATTLATTPLNIGFRRSLTRGRWDRWIHLVERLMHIQLNSSNDIFKWNLVESGKFSVKSMYLDMLNDNTIFLKKYLWKMKVPLEIKIFMWFVYRKEILTKDNLKKRNWQGSTSCCFCDHEETVQHLFIECPFAKIIWTIVHIALNITPPSIINHLFGTWLNGISKSEKVNIRVGVCALIWTIWHVRNEFIFNESKFLSFLQVIPLATHWIHMWSFLRPVEQRQDMDIGSKHLATVVGDIYSRFGWRSDRRLTC
jgi:hypothetical protein